MSATLETISLPTLHIVKRGTLTEDEIAMLKNSNPQIEVVSEEDYVKRIEAANKAAAVEFLKEIKPLNFSAKLEWYSKRNSQELIFLGNNAYFQSYWKWHVLIPLKIKRFYYRLKNGELWKHYQHISEMKEKVKKHSI